MAAFKYLLETSTCIEILRGNQRVRERCIEHNQQCCISIITAIELLYGAYNAPEQYRDKEISKAKSLIEYYTNVGIDDIPEVFGIEKIRLESMGQAIEDFDLMIGITGREAGLVVVTHNQKHFNRIDGLETKDWTI